MGLVKSGAMLKHWLGLSTLVIALDQASKLWITDHFQYGESFTMLSIFNLVLARNTGAAFSFLHDAGGIQRWLFSVIALVASVWIISLLRKNNGSILFSLSLSLILGGALGNLIDRVVFGYVVDFIQFHYETHYFPAFNIADSAISCGAALMIYDNLTGHKHGSVTG